MKNWLFYIAAAACMASCIYPFDPDLDKSAEKQVVVDGMILVGGISTIKLDYLTPVGANTSGNPYGTAWIEDNQGTKYKPATAKEEYGKSFAIPTLPAAGATQFRAVVQVDGETYVSEWITPDPAPVIEKIDFTADDSMVTVSVSLSPGLVNSGYVGFLYEETWEFHSDLYPEYYIDIDNWEYYTPEEDYEYPYYWCWTQNSVNEITLLDYTTLDSSSIRNFPLKTFSRSNNRNHKKYSILVKAFALSREAYQYNKQVQEMSELGGDLFSPNPGNLSGNLTCQSNPDKKVMGLVLAGNVASKRGWMGSDYMINRPPTGIEYLEALTLEEKYNLYMKNYRPSVDAYIEGTHWGIGWVPHRCINCVEAGGSQKKPDFWDN